jgi:hypothetical protein
MVGFYENKAFGALISQIRQKVSKAIQFFQKM